MLDIKELETAITKLPPEKLFELAQWFEEFMAEQWDKQIESDVVTGHLDKIALKIDNDFLSGYIKPL